MRFVTTGLFLTFVIFSQVAYSATSVKKKVDGQNLLRHIHGFEITFPACWKTRTTGDSTVQPNTEKSGEFEFFETDECGQKVDPNNMEGGLITVDNYMYASREKQLKKKSGWGFNALYRDEKEIHGMPAVMWAESVDNKFVRWQVFLYCKKSKPQLTFSNQRTFKSLDEELKQIKAGEVTLSENLKKVLASFKCTD